MNKNTRALINQANGQKGVRNYNASAPMKLNAGKGFNSAGGQAAKNFTVNNAPSADYFTVNVTSTEVYAENFVLFDALRPLWIFNTGEFVPLVPAQTITIDPTTGNIVYTNAATNTIVINCQEMPAYSLFNSTIQKPFTVSGIRYSSLTQAQQGNAIVFYNNRDFLGSSLRNKLNPKASLSPLQLQTLTLDIVVGNLEVNAETAVVSTINASESLTWVFAVSFYNTDNEQPS